MKSKKITLFPHQTKAIKLFKDKDYFALFFEPRTGKTLTTLLLLRKKKVNYAIVIAPLNAFDSWKRDCKLLGIPVYEKEFVKKGKKGVYLWNYEAFNQDKYLVMAQAYIKGEIKLPAIKNKEILKKLKGYIKDAKKHMTKIRNFFKYYVNSQKKKEYIDKLMNWKKLYNSMEKFKPKELALVLDESHRIKNPQANTTQAILNLASLVKTRILLSGTPIEKYEDLYTQMLFLDKSLLGPFKSFWMFKQYIASVDPSRGFIRYYKKKNVREIQKKLEPYMMTVKYEDVFKHKLANQKVIEKIHHVNITLDDLETDILNLDIPPEKMNPLMEINLYYKLNGGVLNGKFIRKDKLNKIIEIIKSIKPSKSIIIWTWFEDNAETLAKELKKKFKKRNVVVNTGTNKNYKEWIDKRGILVTTYCIKEGQDLSFCNNVIYFDLPFAWRDYKQSYNRVINPNKKTTTNVNFIFSEFDIKVKEVILDKKSSILKNLYEFGITSK